MPKATKGGEPKSEELPSTLQRSSKEAQETYAKAHDSAVETYGEGQRAHRTAYSALKHKFEKKGNRWVKKEEKGPSDPRARNPRAREGKGKTFGGGGRRGQLQEGTLRARRRPRRAGPLQDVEGGAGPGDRAQAGVTAVPMDERTWLAGALAPVDAAANTTA